MLVGKAVPDQLKKSAYHFTLSDKNKFILEYNLLLSNVNVTGTTIERHST